MRLVEVVNYIENSRKSRVSDGVNDRKCVFMARPADDSDTDDADGESERVARVPEKKANKSPALDNKGGVTKTETTVLAGKVDSIMEQQKQIWSAIQGQTANNNCSAGQSQWRDNTTQGYGNRGASHVPYQMVNNGRGRGGNRGVVRGRGNSGRVQTQRAGNVPGACFNCGNEGHFARNCPQAPWLTGHMQMAVQPWSSVTPPPFPQHVQWQQGNGNVTPPQLPQQV